MNTSSLLHKANQGNSDAMVALRIQNDDDEPVSVGKQQQQELHDVATPPLSPDLDDSISEDFFAPGSAEKEGLVLGSEPRDNQGRRRDSLKMLWKALPQFFLPDGDAADQAGGSSATENSPLLPRARHLDLESGARGRRSSEKVGNYDSEDSKRSLLSLKSYNSWNLVKQMVADGEFLIDTAPPASVSFEGKECVDKSKKRLEVEEAIRNGMEFSLTHCLLAIFVYILVSVLAFSFTFEDWTVIDSMYFACVTFTTVGYGDLFPETRNARIFTCFFALSGIVCLGIALGIVGDNMVAAHEKAVERATKISRERVVGMFLTKSERGSPQGEELELEESESKIENKATKRVWGLFRQFSLVVLVLIIYSVLVAGDPGVSAGESFYYTVITATTVGLGDCAPQTQKGRLIATIFIPLAVGAMGNWLSGIASMIMDRRQAGLRKQLEEHELTLDEIEAMDTDGDGEVTRVEFLEFMLISMNKVDRELIDELYVIFNRLDATGSDTISKDDLIEKARRRLHSPARKLELADYKRKLLEQGGCSYSSTDV